MAYLHLISLTFKLIYFSPFYFPYFTYLRLPMFCQHGPTYSVFLIIAREHHMAHSVKQWVESSVQLAIHSGTNAHMGSNHWRQHRNTSTAPTRMQRQVHRPANYLAHRPVQALYRPVQAVVYTQVAAGSVHKREHRLSVLEQS